VKRIRATLIAVLAALAAAHAAAAEDSAAKSNELSVHRGGIVFMHYCVNCHGITADGSGRMAKLYNPKPANLVKSDKNDQYKELIVRRGGEAIGRSKFMPPWGEELTNEQVKDVVAFMRSIQEHKPKD
jgi:mono/diheme cytochrome c family protein